MRRQEAIAALLAAQSKPVTPTESTPSRGTRQGLTSAGAPLSRVRDRMTVAENIPAPGQKAETWDESVERHRREVLAEGERRRTQRGREAAERKAAEDRKRWKAEEDARMLREMQERQAHVTEHNLISGELRAVLSDATASEVEAVLKLVREWKTERFAPSYATALGQIRTERK